MLLYSMKLQLLVKNAHTTLFPLLLSIIKYLKIREVEIEHWQGYYKVTKYSFTQIPLNSR